MFVGLQVWNARRPDGEAKNERERIYFGKHRPGQYAGINLLNILQRAGEIKG